MKTQTLLQDRKIIISYLVIIFIFPPIAIHYGVIPGGPLTNLITLAVCSISCILIMIREGWGFNELDLKIEKGMPRVYIVFTLVGIVFLLLMKYILGLELNFEVVQRKYFLAVFVPLCFLQVLCYRVFLIRKLKLLTQSKSRLVALNTIFFTIMHIMFSYKFIIICFLGGIGFAWVYLQYPSLVLMTISHSILNFTAALLGAFNPQ